jgi:hypothetical protein
MSDPLATYMHDHMSGARAAIDLLEAMRKQQQRQPLGEVVTVLLTEIQADLDTLRQVAEKVGGGGSNVLKELTGRLGEKVTRWKLGQSSADPFGTFEALEFLALGVRGKMSMWVALDVAATREPRLSGFDFKRLAGRAESQYQIVEQQRLSLAASALVKEQPKQ